jgi:hypothetical protein
MTGGRLARDISRAVPKQQAFAVEALLSPVERKGLITKGAVLEEIRRLRAQAPKAR